MSEDMFLGKTIQPMLGIKVMKYVSLIANAGKVLNRSKIKYNGLKNQKLKSARKMKKSKEIIPTTFTAKNMFDKLLSKFLYLKILRAL